MSTRLSIDNKRKGEFSEFPVSNEKVRRTDDSLMEVESSYEGNEDDDEVDAEIDEQVEEHDYEDDNEATIPDVTDEYQTNDTDDQYMASIRPKRNNRMSQIQTTHQRQNRMESPSIRPHRQSPSISPHRQTPSISPNNSISNFKTTDDSEGGDYSDDNRLIPKVADCPSTEKVELKDEQSEVEYPVQKFIIYVLVIIWFIFIIMTVVSSNVDLPENVRNLILKLSLYCSSGTSKLLGRINIFGGSGQIISKVVSSWRGYFQNISLAAQVISALLLLAYV